MGKVDCCSIEGFELVFYSNDHLPPHVHVRKPGKWDIRVDLMLNTENKLVFRPVWPKAGIGPSGRDQRRIRNLIVEYRGELLDEWNHKVCQG